jgi:hypothetical protein
MLPNVVVSAERDDDISLRLLDSHEPIDPDVRHVG